MTALPRRQFLAFAATAMAGGMAQAQQAGPFRTVAVAGAAAGKELRAVYRETYDKLKPKYGQWVIFDHCMPFDVTRAYDEATQYPDPRIWTAERDVEMWKALEA